MSRRKKDYLKIYKKYIDTDSTFEKKRFNDFKNMYLQKLDSSDFDIDVEKCKLILRTDSRIDNAFSLYCSGTASVLIALSGIYFALNQNKPGTAFIYAGSLLLIAAFFIYSVHSIVESSIHSDVYNIALVALDAAIKEKHKE